jgi:hypothetical protein
LIPKGASIAISAVAACGSTGTITLLDDSKTYAVLKKENEQISPQPLGHVVAVYSGGTNLRLEFNITHTSYIMKLKSIVNHLDISDENGDLKGGIYNIAIENWTDTDYNDYVVTIVADYKKH